VPVSNAKVNWERRKAQFILFPCEDEVRAGNLIHNSSRILTNRFVEMSVDLWTLMGISNQSYLNNRLKIR
jgi:hypothetical protein